MRTLKLTKETIQNILTDLLKRSPNNYTQYESSVNEIIANVRTNGDTAKSQRLRLQRLMSRLVRNY